MEYAVITIHVMVSISLVLIVLLQAGRGAELGAAFGGMGQATYGRGQSTFITKLTTGLAVVFMSTSLYLAFLTTDQPNRSIVRPEASQPAIPAALPEREDAKSQPESTQKAEQANQEKSSAQPPQKASPAPQRPASQGRPPPNPNPQPATNR